MGNNGGGRKRTGTYKLCKQCNEEFYVRPSLKRLKYCSPRCYWDSLKGRPVDNSHLIGHVPWNKGKSGKYWFKPRRKLVCKECGKVTYFSRAIKCRINPKAKFCNWDCYVKHVKKDVLENTYYRQNSLYKEWRKAVLRRDNYTCQECEKRGGDLTPHHIKRFAYYPELRYEISNGITLCKACHDRKHYHLNEEVKNEEMVAV